MEPKDRQTPPDARAQHRAYVLNHVLTGGLTAGEAARVLGLSVREVRRLLKRYRADDAAGLVHGNRERTPAHRVPAAIRELAIELATTTYAGVNHSHLADARRAARRQAQPDPGRARPRRCRDRLDRRPQRPSQGPGRAPVGGRSRTGSSASCAWPGITTIEDASACLPEFLDRHNARFAVPAADPRASLAAAARRPRLRSHVLLPLSAPGQSRQHGPAGWALDLALPRRADGRSWAGRSVTVGERLDGSLWVSHADLCVPLAPAPADPGQLRARRLSRPTEDRPELDLGLLAPAPSAERRASRPAADHPWRRRYSGRGR